MAPEFKPGTFEPVLTVSQRGDGLTRAFHGDSQGLADVALDSFRIAYSSSMGQGGNISFNRPVIPQYAKLLSEVMWLKNLANQLSELNINNRFSKELAFSFPIPEPVVKLFNCYGHVEHESVKYAQLDLERAFACSLVDLVEMAKDADFTDEDDLHLNDVTHDEWLRRIRLNPQGEIEISTQQSVAQYVSDIVAHLTTRAIPPEQRLRYVKSIIDVATERDLAVALGWLRRQPNVGNLPARGNDRINTDFRNRIWKIFGDHAPTDNGSVLDSKHINKSIHRIMEGLRTAIDEFFNTMALVPLPRYEQGSLAQMSETSDDLTFSHFPLSLADLTVSAGFKVGRVLRRFLRASPELTNESLRGELVRKSVRRRT